MNAPAHTRGEGLSLAERIALASRVAPCAVHTVSCTTFVREKDISWYTKLETEVKGSDDSLLHATFILRDPKTMVTVMSQNTMIPDTHPIVNEVNGK